MTASKRARPSWRASEPPHLLNHSSRLRRIELHVARSPLERDRRPVVTRRQIEKELAVHVQRRFHVAAVAVRDKAIKAAAEMLEASAEDLELKDGAVQVKGVPQMRETVSGV